MPFVVGDAKSMHTTAVNAHDRTFTAVSLATLHSQTVPTARDQYHIAQICLFVSQRPFYCALNLRETVVFRAMDNTWTDVQEIAAMTLSLRSEFSICRSRARCNLVCLGLDCILPLTRGYGNIFYDSCHCPFDILSSNHSTCQVWLQAYVDGQEASHIINTI